MIEGGSFEGPQLKGKVLKGGSDWLISRPRGALQLGVRLTLKTDDGHLIGMIYRGYRCGPAAVIDRLNCGEKLEPSEYYFRTAPFLRDFVGEIRLAQPHHRHCHWPPVGRKNSIRISPDLPEAEFDQAALAVETVLYCSRIVRFVRSAGSLTLTVAATRVPSHPTTENLLGWGSCGERSISWTLTVIPRQHDEEAGGS